MKRLAEYAVLFNIFPIILNLFSNQTVESFLDLPLKYKAFRINRDSVWDEEKGEHEFHGIIRLQDQNGRKRDSKRNYFLKKQQSAEALFGMNFCALLICFCFRRVL